QKGFMEVLARPMQPAEARFIPLSSGKTLRDIKGTEAELEEMSSKDEFANDWLRITVCLDAPRVGLGEKIRKMFPNALEVRISLTGLEGIVSPAEARRHHVPEELYRAYLTKRNGVAPPESIEAFRLLFEEVRLASD